MDYTRLGKSGVKVSPLCLGTMTLGTPDWKPWVLDKDQSRPILKRALDAGINFFDCADWYSIGVGEEVVGRQLLEMTRRQDLVLTTKAYYPMGSGPNDGGLSRKHIMEAIDASLKRLGTDYVDVYMMHAWDPETPIEETLEALNDVVRQGKALYLGASTMWAWQFSKLIHTAKKNGWTDFSVMQCQYNLVFREHESEMFPLCEDAGVAVTPFSPLARGFLCGDRTRDGKQLTTRAQTDEYAQSDFNDEGDFRIADKVAEIAARRGVTRPQVAMAWVLQKNAITAPLIGVDRPEQIDEAVGALDIYLTDKEMAALEAPYRRRAMIIDHPAECRRLPPKMLKPRPHAPLKAA